MCKHNWIIILPKSEEIEESKRIDYMIEKMLSRLSDIFYCTKCYKTGHQIKSYRGGIRVHYYSEGWFVNKANSIREKYGFEKLNSEQNPKRSVATEDDSSTKPD